MTDSISEADFSIADGVADWRALYWGAKALESGEATRFESAPASGLLGRVRDGLGHLLP